MKNSLLVDENELKRFIEWLPDIGWDEAYLVMILIRSKMLKKIFGFKGTDHTLQRTIVPGYYREYTKLMLEKTIKRYALLGYYSRELFMYFRHKPGTDEVEEAIEVPRELIGIMILINPVDWINASLLTVNDVVRAFYSAWRKPKESEKLIRRIDTRYLRNCHSREKRMFHQIDVDTKEKEVISVLEDKFIEYLGFIPAHIETPHGYHYLVPVHKFTSDISKRWFKPKEKKKRKQTSITFQEWLEKYDKELGGKILEYKKQTLEPVPGTLYQGDFVVRFTPEKQ